MLGSFRRGVIPLQPAAGLLLVVAVVAVPAEAGVLLGCLLPLPLPLPRVCVPAIAVEEPSSSTWLGAEPYASVFVWSSLSKTVSPFVMLHFQRHQQLLEALPSSLPTGGREGQDLEYVQCIGCDVRQHHTLSKKGN